MKASRLLARASQGVPALHRTTQPPPVISRALSSSSRTTTARSSRILATPQPHPRQCALSRGPVLAVRGSWGYASSPGSSEAAPPLQKTALYDYHIAHGAKMVPFGGYHMPVQYAGQSVVAEHHFTRRYASLFDVGHMVQHHFSGPGATDFLQLVTPAGLEALAAHHSTLSALLWPDTGGIVDDTIITRLGPDKFYVVTNAACREKDLAYFSQQLSQWRAHGHPEVTHEVLEGRGLVALQGPLAERILSDVLAADPAVNLRELYFGQSRTVQVRAADGRVIADVLASRGGYTGEDGFELSVAGPDTVALTEALFAAAGPQRLRLAGLGARDSLRLEAGMCLYGHDLDDTTTPVEAGLSWIIGRDRRTGAAAGFHGADKILPQLTPKSKGGTGVTRRRVGLLVEGAPAREGAPIVASADAGAEVLGAVTSGCPSPTLRANIAMGYVRDTFFKAGTELAVVVRGRARKAVVTKMPFVLTKYWRDTVPA
ncbi:hypothetical protein GGS23DRAFT_552696 [Durotheca rogersii]|uniref:uncharacterized protein n=1 Tax=Durotheca rogersii TaxID=419775 RepID=UPI0022211DF1|nr:uncharacterized protein GGS23DRAFT_552696 [Durotheca rogersii]KAI5866911.1 hypothetical protein GGS23DRAFT_552696 [Durotheca rogersii]